MLRKSRVSCAFLASTAFCPRTRIRRAKLPPPCDKSPRSSKALQIRTQVPLKTPTSWEGNALRNGHQEYSHHRHSGPQAATPRKQRLGNVTRCLLASAKVITRHSSQGLLFWRRGATGFELGNQRPIWGESVRPSPFVASQENWEIRLRERNAKQDKKQLCTRKGYKRWTQS